MSDVASASASAAPPTRKSRGANPSTDYKSLFLKSKDKYDRVSTDHTDLKANVTKATAKQQKLREELDYLLDAVASKRVQRAQIEQSHRDHALELEREAAAAVAAAEAARRRASSLARRDRDHGVYEARASRGGYEGAEEYVPYSARYAEPSYRSFGSGMNRSYASPPPPPAVGTRRISVDLHRGEDQYAASDGSRRGSVHRDTHASASYRPAGSQSPPPYPRTSMSTSHASHPHEPHSSPSRSDAHPRYPQSTPPLPSSSTSSAVKRPRPSSVERELLDADDAYHTKRARND
ncbi:leucine-rich repeat-containing protein 40 [Pseudozyma hubeiensis SY62]|uniref:Leucine-rich repeat-containing protein 40 n=1 Tax=Pseudozyma hubeiensis (strain SY62) TaxID=1305764 RepID=R9P8S0_PSEHS|nr:leucine-rich repeat-containing protein 40 [Pseudozyma hubeiensis SY62]GAC97657.1 leucine-rich repeat-containing protein 40 [Pseudozyma hubeiensis SY62]